MAETRDKKKVLLTGATGFVGRHVFYALEAAGYEVRCSTRNPEQAKLKFPEREWVQADLENETSIASAIEGCSHALFLVHGMVGNAGDYPKREQRSAAAFAEAARQAGVERVVYLGGVSAGILDQESRHLRSRRETGEVLRKAGPSTIELKAAMIIGSGSAGWVMVRDLAARLPAMVLPRWLKNTSSPVSIYDVAAALLAALALNEKGSLALELPGRELVSHREFLDMTAKALERRPIMWNVPLLSPKLSAYWIAMVTRADLSLAKELVEGVKFNLIPKGESIWDRCGGEPMPVEDAIRLAIEDEGDEEEVTPSAITRLKQVGAGCLVTGEHAL